MPLSPHVPGLSPESKRPRRHVPTPFRCLGCSKGGPVHALLCVRAPFIAGARHVVLAPRLTSADFAQIAEHAREREPVAARSRGPSCEPCGGLERVGDAECFECRPVLRDGLTAWDL